MPVLPRFACALIPITLLAACGGEPSPAPGTAPAPAAAPPAPIPTTLAASVSQLALATNGQARVITLTNTGAAPALNLSLSPTALPAGTAISGNTCASTLNPGSSCSITITPGATPSAAIADPAPAAALLDLQGDNTNTVVVSLSVIGYGSAHQGGYVFDIDDSTPATGSVAGKVAALDNLTIPQPWGGSGSAVSGVNESDTALSGCEGALDGACNTARIVAQLGAGNYAAQACQSSTAAGHSDWYLPATCELGYDPSGLCGSQTTPRLAGNMQSRLMDSGHFNQLTGNFYWSSTQWSIDPTNQAGWHYFNPGAGAKNFDTKSNVRPVRCVRAFTP